MKRLLLSLMVLGALAAPTVANSFVMAPDSKDTLHFNVFHPALQDFKFRVHRVKPETMPENWQWLLASGTCGTSCNEPARKVTVEAVVATEGDCRQASLVWQFEAPYLAGNTAPVQVFAGGCLLDHDQAKAFYEEATGSTVPTLIELVREEIAPSPARIETQARAVKSK